VKTRTQPYTLNLIAPVTFAGGAIAAAVFIVGGWNPLAQPKPSSQGAVVQQSFESKYQMARAIASETASTTATIPYIVKPGDTLQSIAETYGVPPSEIARATPAPIDFLHTGQTLAIPKAATIQPTTRPRTETFIWPVPGPAIAQENSLDISAPLGTPVVAVQSGTVITSGQKYNGYGNMVDVLHTDGTVTRYGHGAKLLVRAGETVRQGQPIMYVGCSGHCTQPHVRFEVRVQGRQVNPLAFLP